MGQNVLIAYMPWEGYNYEDALLVSERLVTDDLYTSVHIEKYEIEARQTKLGQRKSPVRSPTLVRKALAILDEMGIIRVGAFVKVATSWWVSQSQRCGTTGKTAPRHLWRESSRRSR